jgi:peptide-methionine (S)-S-oxide reductase
LKVFFAIHDPTTLNRQGADVGTQYRSVIFYHDGEQKVVAEELIASLEMDQLWSQPIITEVAPLEAYYKAEEYHQDYFQNNPSQPYCQAVVSPKVAKFRKEFLSKLKN